MAIKALTIKEFGDSSKLQYGEIPKPEPAEEEVTRRIRSITRSLFVYCVLSLLCVSVEQFRYVSFLSDTSIEAKNNIYNKEINNYHF